MEFAVLGPLEVRRDGDAVALPGGKPRLLLARLLVDAGRVVSVDALADALWGDAPPEHPAATIQVHVSNLRRAIGATTIVTRSPGYAVSAAPDELDHERVGLHLAAARVARADGRAADALDEARRALSLVRGDPYAEFAFDEWARAEIVRLGGLVLAAHEEAHAALLDLGRHREAISTLESLVAAHPFHERLRGQLMLALYRDGRQADALRRYAEGRELLVEQLGVEPGPELRQMEARVLAHDEGLLPPTRPRPVDPPAPPPPAPSTSPAPSTAATRLVGRSAELGLLRASWADACRGEPRVVLLAGQPGMGKSALAGWVSELAATDGGLVGYGVAHEHAGAPPYWPWSAALRDVAAAAGGVLEAAVDDTPGAGDVAALWSGGELDVAGGRQFTMFDAVIRVLERVTGAAPALVVLDDLQWADEATLDLLRFTARARPRARLLVVAAHRPPVADDALALLLADLATDPAVRRVVLRGLPADDVGRLVDQLVPAPTDPALVTAIAASTGGNPFYVRELVRELSADGGGLDAARAAVPESVRAAVRARAARLGDPALAVLTLGSFAGGEFDDVVMPAVLGVDPVDVTTALDAAVREGLLVEVEGRAGYHRFAHDIVRHAFYDAVPQRRRAETHLGLGRAMVAALGERAVRRAPEIAGHFARGVDHGGAAEAVHWLREAAAQAVRSGAYGDALRHLRRATFVVRSRLDDDRVECEVLVEVAAAARLAADPATAQVARDRARRLAARCDDPALAARATEVLLAPGPHWLRRAR